MPKERAESGKKATLMKKSRPKPQPSGRSSLSDREIHDVFKMLRLSNQDISRLDHLNTEPQPVLYFPLSTSTPADQPITW
jgi:hypothetical protein